MVRSTICIGGCRIALEFLAALLLIVAGGSTGLGRTLGADSVTSIQSDSSTKSGISLGVEGGFHTSDPTYDAGPYTQIVLHIPIGTNVALASRLAYWKSPGIKANPSVGIGVEAQNIQAGCIGVRFGLHVFIEPGRMGMYLPVQGSYSLSETVLLIASAAVQHSGPYWNMDPVYTFGVFTAGIEVVLPQGKPGERTGWR